MQQLRRRLRAQGGATGLVTRLAGLQKKEETIQKVRGRGRGRVSVSVCVRGRFRVRVRVSVSVSVRVS